MGTNSGDDSEEKLPKWRQDVQAFDKLLRDNGIPPWAFYLVMQLFTAGLLFGAFWLFGLFA